MPEKTPLPKKIVRRTVADGDDDSSSSDDVPLSQRRGIKRRSLPTEAESVQKSVAQSMELLKSLDKSAKSKPKPKSTKMFGIFSPSAKKKKVSSPKPSTNKNASPPPYLGRSFPRDATLIDTTETINVNPISDERAKKTVASEEACSEPEAPKPAMSEAERRREARARAAEAAMKRMQGIMSQPPKQVISG